MISEVRCIINFIYQQDSIHFVYINIYLVAINTQGNDNTQYFRNVENGVLDIPNSKHMLFLERVNNISIRIFKKTSLTAHEWKETRLWERTFQKACYLV